MMLWPQKLFAVALHLDGLGTGSVLTPADFMVEVTTIKVSGSYQNLISMMRILSDDYHDQEKDVEIWHTHKTNQEQIMLGKVKIRSGMIFKRHATTWACKLPNRNALNTWLNCNTQTANKDTQRFVMFFLSCHGTPKGNYDAYPWDKFYTSHDPAALASLLNGLR